MRLSLMKLHTALEKRHRDRYQREVQAHPLAATGNGRLSLVIGRLKISPERELGGQVGGCISWAGIFQGLMPEPLTLQSHRRLGDMNIHTRLSRFFLISTSCLSSMPLCVFLFSQCLPGASRYLRGQHVTYIGETYTYHCPWIHHVHQGQLQTVKGTGVTTHEAGQKIYHHGMLEKGPCKTTISQD